MQCILLTYAVHTTNIYNTYCYHITHILPTCITHKANIGRRTTDTCSDTCSTSTTLVIMLQGITLGTTLDDHGWATADFPPETHPIRFNNPLNVGHGLSYYFPEPSAFNSAPSLHAFTMIVCLRYATSTRHNQLAIS